MKKLFFALQFPLFVAFNFFVLTAVFEVAISDSGSGNSSKSAPRFDGKEEYDPSLGRLNSLEKLKNYCDSVFAADYAIDKSIRYEEAYPQIATAIVRKRFYHGYSNFGWGNNFMASFLSRFTGKSANAIVLPDEILKYPYGACSQQSIVTIELLRSKGFITRAIRFTGVKNGHFSFETFYKGSWHFFDPDMEPNQALLSAYNRPGIAYIAGNKALLMALYKGVPEDKVLDIFTNYNYGKTNAAPAPWATLYQKTTKFLSYSLWIFFLMAFIWVRRKYRRLSSSKNYVRNSRVYLPQFQPGTSPTYHFGS